MFGAASVVLRSGLEASLIGRLRNRHNDEEPDDRSCRISQIFSTPTIGCCGY